MKYSKEDVLEAISNMSVIEISELILMIEKKFSISINNINVNNNLSIDNNVSNKDDKKTEFNILLKSIGNNKISIIKFIRSLKNIGLKEAKDLIDSCPIIIKENISIEESENIKKELENFGAVVEIL